MSHITTILLIVICILLIWDTYILYSIFQRGKKGKKILSDERYFELKYNLNLLKAVSAILIFVLGFLGYTNYSELRNKIDSDFSTIVDIQNQKIDTIDYRLSKYSEILDSLEIFKKEVSNAKSQIPLINKKLNQINTTTKYNPKIYIIQNLKYLYEANYVKFYFKDMKTIFNEKLPRFTKKPLVNIGGAIAGLDIVELNESFVKLHLGAHSGFSEKNPEFIYFDIWIASYD